MPIALARLDDLIAEDGHQVPVYLLNPDRKEADAVMVHGYDGWKEEMLGLASRLAESGVAPICLDLRGHGEHPAPLGAGVLSTSRSL